MVLIQNYVKTSLIYSYFGQKGLTVTRKFLDQKTLLILSRVKKILNSLTGFTAAQQQLFSAKLEAHRK
jgi:hypothetical protein